MLDCVMTMKQPFITPIYDFTAPRIVFGRVAMVGDAAANARPHMGFGVAKAGGDAQALARALGNHDDIDTALKAYNAERQPIGNTIVDAQPQARHPYGRQPQDRGRPPHARAAARRRRDDGLDRGAEFSGRLQMSDDLPKPDYARNMRLVGYSDQGGRPDGVQVMVHRGHAYVGHMFSKGFSVDRRARSEESARR